MQRDEVIRSQIEAMGYLDLELEERLVAAEWHTPTGHVDPESTWISHTNAYDGNTATFAYHYAVENAWTNFLELTHSAIDCDKIRFYMAYSFGLIDVDVYYEGGWHHVYSGVHATGEWVEKDIPAGTKSVSAAQIRIYRDGASVSPTFNEFAFWEVGAVGWTGKISGVTNPAKIMGVDVANIAKVKGVA